MAGLTASVATDEPLPLVMAIGANSINQVLKSTKTKGHINANQLNNAYQQYQNYQNNEPVQFNNLPVPIQIQQNKPVQIKQPTTIKKVPVGTYDKYGNQANYKINRITKVKGDKIKKLKN